MTDNRQFRVNLSNKDSEALKHIADKLGVNESEVIRKGLQLMTLYAKTRDTENSAIIYQEGDKSKEIMVI